MWVVSSMDGKSRQDYVGCDHCDIWGVAGGGGGDSHNSEGGESGGGFRVVHPGKLFRFV